VKNVKKAGISIRTPPSINSVMSTHVPDEDTSATAAAGALPFHILMTYKLMLSLADAATLQVSGSKRLSGNDIFREQLMASSAEGLSHCKRQAVGIDEGVQDKVDWQELKTDRGRTYFMHLPTGRGQWNRPALLVASQLDAEGERAEGAASASVNETISTAAAVDPAT
jgi:hypothetical protein